MIRREFLRLGGVLIGATAFGQPDAIEPLQRLAKAVRQPSRTDLESVRHLEHLTLTFESLEAHASPHALVRPISGHLATITSLLEGTPPSTYRAQLLSLAAESAGLLAWLTWDLGTASRAQARAYVRTALDAAREAGDQALGAYLLGTASVVEHPKDEAEGRLSFLVDKPFGFSASEATPATRAWLAALEAEANALLGRTTNSLRALDQAELAWSRPSEDQLARPRATFFDAARLAGERGICLTRLGRPADAAMELRAALTTLPSDQEKSRSRLLAALATTHVQTGNVDEACRLGSEALGSAVGMAVQPNVHDVLTLRQLLQPWSDTAAVRDLDDRLAVIA